MERMRKEDIYIVGGGTSLRMFDFSQLEHLDTIAVNVAALDVPNPTYCITADSGILRKIQEGYFKSINTTWVLVTNPNHCSMKWKDGKFKHHNGYVYNLFVVDMIIKNVGVEGIGFEFNDFRTGYNSGFCAFQLAVLLGYKRIHLLGFDLCENESRTHYHNRYKNRKTIDDKSFTKFYDNFVLAIEVLKEKTDIKIISHSKISRLNSFVSYISLREIS